MDNITKNKILYVKNIILILAKRLTKESDNEQLKYYYNIHMLMLITLNIVENNKKLKLELMKLIVPTIVNDVILKITNLTLEEFITDINKFLEKNNKQITDVNNNYLSKTFNEINNMEDIIYYMYTKMSIIHALSQPLMVIFVWNDTNHHYEYPEWNKKVADELNSILY